MRIGFIVNEFFKYGSYGGYGFATKAIARGLKEKGVETFLLVNTSRLKTMPHPIEIEQGIPVIGYKAGKINFLKSIPEFKQVDADIFQTCNISLDTNYCMKTMTESKHVINFQDPRNSDDWKEIYSHPTALKQEGGTSSSFSYDIRFALASLMYKKAILDADGLTVQANYLKDKVNKMFSIKAKYEFMPNPIAIPERKMKKSEKPTAIFLGRLDIIKRPEIFFELAKKFPNINFFIMGTATRKQDNEKFERKYKLRNLKFLGLITNEEKKSEILEKTWMIINTSLHECLPVSFLEAWAHKCAVLSCQNPDDLTRKYGYYTGKILGTGLDKESMKKFENGMRFLLKDDKWEKLGKNGHEYVRKNHEFDSVIDKHIKYYKNIIK
ncbi:glycosyltransferase family 4 protein [Candidatus Pacearchaeota archaeon]|nr:glycosyltransferase family 4 protein [Candidatus Pacearchaeota archaeon]